MESKKHNGTSWIAVLVVVALLCVGAYFVARSIASSRSTMLRSAIKTMATADQQVVALGDGILYYDGATLHALDAQAKQVWNYAVGVNGGFSVGTGGVAAWAKSVVSILNGEDGSPLFSRNVDIPVLDARVGTVYTALQVGEEQNSDILLMESGGRQVQRIELKNQTVLDFGFFNDDALFWVMSLNTEGTTPLCSITTYRPGKMLRGTIEDTQQVLYEVVFQSSQIRAIGTTHIKDYSYVGKETTQNRMLVYGWYLMGIDERADNPMMAFVPIDQSDGSTGISDLRMVRGRVDQTMRLPHPAMRVLAQGDTVYAFTNQYVSVCRLGDKTPTTYALPLYVERILGITQTGACIAASGGAVYLIPMP